MKLNSSYSFNFGELNEIYFKLLFEEDYNFKTKDIKIEITKTDDDLLVMIFTNSVLDLKIATTALIKSLEIIDNTLNI